MTWNQYKQTEHCENLWDEGTDPTGVTQKKPKTLTSLEQNLRKRYGGTN
jgi:hypothetical protein